MERTVNGTKVQWPLRAANVKQRNRRNGYEIHGYTGTNGGGKTFAAVYDSLPALAAGRPIVSTCRIFDPRTGQPHPLWVPLDDFRMLVADLEYCTVILDEVTGVASSRDSAGLPSAVLNKMMQLRKADVDIRWTTPNWKRADTGIREVTKAVTTCVGLMPVQNSEVTPDGLTRTWRQRRLMVWRTYDTKDFDEWSTSKERSNQKSARARCISRQLVWGPGSVVHDMYDTYETALTLGVVSEAGLCMDCGGKRTARRCSCGPEEVVKDASFGMLRWKEVDAYRRSREGYEEITGRPWKGTIETPDLSGDLGGDPEPVIIPETDDTPGIGIQI